MSQARAHPEENYARPSLSIAAPVPAVVRPGALGLGRGGGAAGRRRESYRATSATGSATPSRRYSSRGWTPCPASRSPRPPRTARVPTASRSTPPRPAPTRSAPQTPPGSSPPSTSGTVCRLTRPMCSAAPDRRRRWRSSS